MKHNKYDHASNMSICWNYQAGNCEFGDSSCWFGHEETSERFKCNTCELDFNCRPDYQKHRKHKHIEMVSNCKHEIKGECVYGEDKCWFKHQSKSKVNCNKTETIENMENEDRIILKKLFDMVEKITKRVVEIEKN